MATDPNPAARLAHSDPAARLAWINDQRAIRGLASLTADAFAVICEEPGVYDDRDSAACAELVARAA